LTSDAKPGAVLAVVDPRTASGVVAAAADQAARRGLDLDVLGVVDPPRDLNAAAAAAGVSPDALLDRLIGAVRREIEAALPTGLNAPVTVRCGKAFIEIIQHARRRGAAMVVKAPDPFAGLAGRLFASTDQHLLRKCPVPVWLCEPDLARPVRTVLAAVDVDPEAEEPDTLADVNARVMETALAVCDAASELHVIHAWQAEDAGLFWAFGASGDGESAAQNYADLVQKGRRRAIDALVAPYKSAAPGPRLIARLVRGAPHAVIAEQVRRVRADVLVMGTVARTGLRGVIIGNTAENILNTAVGSVIAVKPSGFVCPIAED